jgi:uncharacterized protein YjbI with pentapeptide repeats
MKDRAMRKSLEETWRILEGKGAKMPRKPDGTPHLSTGMPSVGDSEVVNITFFRTMWQDADLSQLTLPRIFFGRSGFERVSFRDTELTDSRMCWNDFTRCDFTGADLRRCDMRASVFDSCIFRDADLSGADLRRSTFDSCIFEGANMNDAIVYKKSAVENLIPLLSKDQRAAIRWVHEQSTEPPGG